MVTSLQPGQAGLMVFRIGMDGVYTGRCPNVGSGEYRWMYTGSTQVVMVVLHLCFKIINCLSDFTCCYNIIL